MDPSKRNAAALHARVDELALNIMGHFSNIFASAREEGDAPAYATTANKELGIRGESTKLVRAAQDLTTLVRDLQELWLFGSLDTLADPRDEEENRRRAVEIARLVEKLSGVREGGDAPGNANGV
ncbi:hypothetical protein BS50DRAFT_567024 [Corynespora cassiicola Philippines]|uniref:Mediator of RNA polymerase II transcription subunit 22 n=1 Tax=Corynespora cassiicola Philippines TaxID=1448308 RepID=A0A2T2P924_CORCC|nr:hypothetical protein BS50DRAFT_567024 [Corynespora cassiicola Philippines]